MIAIFRVGESGSYPSILIRDHRMVPYLLTSWSLIRSQICIHWRWQLSCLPDLLKTSFLCVAQSLSWFPAYCRVQN